MHRGEIWLINLKTKELELSEKIERMLEMIMPIQNLEKLSVK